MNDPLRGRYSMRGQIGKGGMGEVYRALDTQTQTIVAIKSMIPPAGDEELCRLATEQFLVEARILGAVSHPNIPRVHECFEDGGRYYIVMDLIQGESAQSVVSLGGPLSAARVIDWSTQIASALKCLHEHRPQPIVYKDLKPENLMITSEGKVILVDFGLAKGGQVGLEQTVLKGAATPPYASPEQLEGREATDARSHLYALGATMYALLTGRQPVPGLYRLEVMRSGFPDYLPALESLRPTAPKSLIDLVEHLMQVDLGKRLQTAAEALERLEGLQAEWRAQPLPTLRSGDVCGAGGRRFRSA